MSDAIVEEKITTKSNFCLPRFAVVFGNQRKTIDNEDESFIRQAISSTMYGITTNNIRHQCFK